MRVSDHTCTYSSLTSRRYTNKLRAIYCFQNYSFISNVKYFSSLRRVNLLSPLILPKKSTRKAWNWKPTKSGRKCH
jgi:hypothetical protein